MGHKQEHIGEVDQLDGMPTSVKGQATLPGMQQHIGHDAIRLQAKHEEFCWKYLAHCGNGMKAYLAVYPGVKESTARVNASKLLTNTNIKARIDEILEDRKSRYAILADRVVEYHQNVLLTDRRVFLDPIHGGLKKLDELDEDAAMMLEVEQVSSKNGVRTLLKVPNRHQSSVELARILGMHKDKMELTGKDGGPVESIANVVNDPNRFASLRDKLKSFKSDVVAAK